MAQQSVTPERQPAEATEAAREAARAAAAAAAGAVAEGPPVTYQQVLADPDNIDLNYRFAQTQIRQGDLKGASATLERILLLAPDLAQVRLLYAVVLYRLDSLDEAERELKAVQALPMPASVRSEVEAYLRKIEAKRRRTRWAASISVGGEYDSNRDAVPASETRLFADTAFPVTPRRSDGGLLTIGSLRVVHDLGYQAGHELFASAVGYQNWQQHIIGQDLQAVALEAGGTYRTDLVDISPSLTYSYLRLNHEKFLHSEGVKLRLDRKLGQTTEIFLQNHFQRQDFDAVRNTANGQDVASSAPQRTGNLLETSLGANFNITPTNQLAVGYLHTLKHAEAGFEAYDADEFRLGDTLLLGKGQFLLGSVSAAWQRYDDPDPFISVRTRHDRLYRARFTYGIPFGTLLPFQLPEALNDVLLTLTVEQLRQVSNIVNFTYDNTKGQALITKRWEF